MGRTDSIAALSFLLAPVCDRHGPLEDDGVLIGSDPDGMIGRPLSSKTRRWCLTESIDLDVLADEKAGFMSGEFGLQSGSLLVFCFSDYLHCPMPPR